MPRAATRATAGAQPIARPRASLEAKRGAELRAAGLLVWEAFRRGRPTSTSLASHAVLWLVPERLRFELLARLGAAKKRA